MIATSVLRTAHGHWPWIRSQKWDLTFLILSSALVSVPLIMHYWLGVSTTAINLLVAGLVGGPHLYSTFTLTFLERSFWRRYPWYTAGALLIPVGVIFLAVVDLTLLLTIFMGWASLHVLQQIAYLTDCYRARAGEPFPGRSQAIDYALLFTSLYPIAMYRLVTDTFQIGKEPIHKYFPVFLKTDLFLYFVWAAFAAALALWLFKTAQEYVEGRLNYPKTLLIGITAVLAFIIPSFDNLDVAFQGMNTWHSFQYLALLWLVNCVRGANGEISSGIVQKIAGDRQTKRFYGFHLGLTLAAGVVILTLYGASTLLFGWGLRFDQCYFMVVLGSLLMHYYFDAFLFTRVGLVLPNARGVVPGMRPLL